MTIKTELKDSLIVAKKEFKILSRKKALIFPLFLFPIIMIVFFGYGMGGTVKDAPILIINDDSGRASSSLVQEIGGYTPKYDANPMFSVTYTKDMSQSEAESKIDAGIYKGALIIPQNYSDSIAKNESATLTLLTDSSDTTTSGAIINALRQLLAKTGLVSLNIPSIYGDLEYLDFITPGVIALTVFMGCISSIGSAIAGEKENGTLVRMLMTPVSKRSVILGKTIYQLILQLARTVVLIFAAYLLVGFNMNGSWLAVALVLIVFTLSGVGIGIIMSSRAEDMESFIQLNMLVTMPSMFVTGVFFPLSSVPGWMRCIAYFLPLTYAIDAMRTIMIKGQGLSAISTDLIILTLFAIVTFTLGVHLFRREA
ncbi:ABC transporter permease [Methanosarcina sp. UBA411]|jgi:ABC-2 type transport system permease protein|uniref:ABC transporter permease n=1 Tax=Methanosarcina sp. UBA411 TaxID=1915589 RepID=UPI0025E3F829|nr:ABC transporter permease [Methanosarcina sp. UBA411]